MRRRAVREGTAWAVFALAVLGSRLLRVPPEDVSAVAPAAGVGMVWLRSDGLRRRPAAVRCAAMVLTGGVVAWLTGVDPTAAATLSAATVLASVVGAVLLVRGGVGRADLRSTRAVMVLVTASLLAGVTASLLVAVLALPGLVPLTFADAVLVAVRTALGCLVVGAVVTGDVAATPRTGVRRLTGLSADVGAVLGYLAVFLAAGHQPLAFSAIPFTLALALRAGVRRTAWHLAAISVMVVVLSWVHVGPFGALPLRLGVPISQLFVGVVAITGLWLAALQAEREAGQAELARVAAELRRTVDTALVAQLTLELDHAHRPVIVAANPAAGTFFRVGSDSLLGTCWLDLVYPQQRAAVTDALDGLAGDTASWSGEVLHRAFGGQVRWAQVELSQRPLDEGQRPRMTLQVLDVSERKAAEQDLARLALHDHLTGAANRRLLTDRMQLAIDAGARTSGRVAVAYLDLDGFKPVNDRYGHAVGDQVLIEVVSRMRTVCRPGDTVARVGGDELVVCAPGVSDVDAAVALAQRLLAAVAAPMEVLAHPVEVSASIGVAFAEPGATAQGLLAAADAAMYEAKRTGGRRVQLAAPPTDAVAR